MPVPVPLDVSLVIPSSGCCWPCMGPNTISLAPDAAECAWTRTHARENARQNASIADRMPDRMPEYLSDRMSEYMMRDRMPEWMPKKMPDRMPERSQKNKLLLFSFFYYYMYIYIYEYIYIYLFIYLHAIYTSTHYMSNYVIIVCRGGDCTKKKSTCLFLFLSVFRSSLFSFLFLFPCSL